MGRQDVTWQLHWDGEGWWYSHIFRNGVQIGFSISPQSRFVFSACLWISMASSTLLFQYPGSCFSTLAFSQSTLCWCSHACTAIPLFVSPLLTAPLCSTNLFFRLLPVSPMYELLQSIHGTSYTTPFFSSCGLGIFTLISALRRVPRDLNTAFTRTCPRIRCMCSDVYCTYGR